MSIKHNNTCHYFLNSQYHDITLSKRQSQCLFYLLRGKSAAATANVLSLSTRTIESYIEEIKNKMGCRNKAELIEKTLALGYHEIIPQGINGNRSQNYRGDKLGKSVIAKLPNHIYWREITERLEMLENCIAFMPGNVYWMDKKGRYLGCNDNEAKAIGLTSRKEIIGKRNVDIPGFIIPEALDPINKKVMATGKSVVAEEPAILHGREAIFLSHKVPIRNVHNKIIGMVGISFDITELKHTQQGLQEAQHKLNSMTLFSADIAHGLSASLRIIGSS